MDDNKQKKPDALYHTQNAIYGKKNGSDDVPYTMEDPSGFRRPISFATRRNLALKLIKKPWLILAFIGIVVAIVVFVKLIT